MRCSPSAASSSSANSAAAASPASLAQSWPAAPGSGPRASASAKRQVRAQQRRELDRAPAGELGERPRRLLEPADERGEAGDVLLARARRPLAPARRRARSSSTRMPAKPPASRGPRRQASSSSRTRCRNAAWGSPPAASGCLSVASSVTGLTPPVIRRADSSRKPPGGV